MKIKLEAVLTAIIIILTVYTVHNHGFDILIDYITR
jgi:hypothetical protein